MRAGGGHAKGAQFERGICDRLSRWVDPRGTDTHFWRSSMSGGRATIRHRAGKLTKSQAGDICSLTRHGHPFLSKFFVECKFVKDLALQAAMLKGVGTLARYWAVLIEEAEKHDKMPILICKENLSPVMVFIFPQHASQMFGAVSRYELARLNRMDKAGGVACYLFDDLFRKRSYASHRFAR